MANQVKADFVNTPFELHGSVGVSRDNETLAQDGGRSGDIVDKTLMAQIAASRKWVPFTNEAATDGTAIPAGIYRGETLTEAAIQAGDITHLRIITGGLYFDESQLVIENSKTLDTVVTVGTTDLRTVRARLGDPGLHACQTRNATQPIV